MVAFLKGDCDFSRDKTYVVNAPLLKMNLRLPYLNNQETLTEGEGLVQLTSSLR